MATVRYFVFVGAAVGPPSKAHSLAYPAVEISSWSVW